MESYMAKNKKEDSSPIIRDIIDLISQNGERGEIIEIIMDKHKKSYSSIYKYYLRAMEMINDDIGEKIEDIRNKKIKALQRDLKEAYLQYQQNILPDIKVKWFKIYQEVKEQLNQYYPNALKHEKEMEDFSIKINYIPITQISKEPEE